MSNESYLTNDCYPDFNYKEIINPDDPIITSGVLFLETSLTKLSYEEIGELLTLSGYTPSGLRYLRMEDISELASTPSNNYNPVPVVISESGKIFPCLEIDYLREKKMK